MQIQRLDDGDFLIHIDCDLRSVAERKMFIAKDEDGNLVNPENVPIIVRLARARKMIEMLSSGTYKNKQEIGDMFGMSQAQVSRLCRSAFLSPVIVEKLVDGSEHSVGTYAVGSVRVGKVTGKVNLVRLNLLKQILDYVDVGLCALPFLDASGFIERKVQEVGVGRVVKTE